MNYKNTRRGFTLIELLVVVLIIGILAAVAVPQYKKAVYKSKYAKLKPLVNAIANAEEVYYLANNEYTDNIANLDLDWSETPSKVTSLTNGTDYTFTWGYCSLNNPNEGDARVVCEDSSIPIRYARYLQHSIYSGKQRCSPIVSEDNPNTIGHEICRAESGLSEQRAHYLW